jgi:hypothetical protein
VVVDESYDDEISITVVATGFQRQDMVAGTQPEPIRKASLPLTIIRNDQSAPERPLEIETIEPVETPYRPAAQEQSTSPVLNVPAGIDPNDPDTPAIWRNKGKHGGGSTQSSAPQRQAASASAPAPQASASPSTYTAPSTTSSDQPDAFLRPRKSASSGGGSGQPAFLRKIMD